VKMHALAKRKGPTSDKDSAKKAAGMRINFKRPSKRERSEGVRNAAIKGKIVVRKKGMRSPKTQIQARGGYYARILPARKRGDNLEVFEIGMITSRKGDQQTNQSQGKL